MESPRRKFKLRRGSVASCPQHGADACPQSAGICALPSARACGTTAPLWPAA